MKPLSNSVVGFIGAGKVGKALGAYFFQKNICIGGYYSKSQISSHKASQNTSSEVFLSIKSCIEACDVIFITTPDSAIQTVWNKIKQFPIEEKVMCHTSGALSSRIFEGIEQRKAYGFSVHPMASITSDKNAYHSLYNAYFTIEGSIQHLSDAKTFFRDLGNSVVSIDADNKILYHAATVILSNFFVVMISSGWDILKQCDIPYDTVKEMTKPLIEPSIQNITNLGVESSLTGPIERNDVNTVQKHLDRLPEKDQKLYVDLSLRLLEIAKEKHPQRDFSILFHMLLKHNEHNHISMQQRIPL